MKISFYILLLIGLAVGCQKEVQPKGVVQESSVSSAKNEAFDASVALKFINDYVGFCNKMPGEEDVLKWITTNADVTDLIPENTKQFNLFNDEDPKHIALMGPGKKTPSWGSILIPFLMPRIILKNLNWNLLIATRGFW